MGEPYGRIVLLHFTVIIGGIAVTALGQPVAMLLILVVLKTVMDVWLHHRLHSRLQTARAEPLDD